MTAEKNDNAHKPILQSITDATGATMRARPNPACNCEEAGQAWQ
jgi:hypothetical protein